MPSSKVSASTPASCRLIPSSSAASGETISSGRPLIIQWATTFTSTTATSGVGRSISCSEEPSCQSSRNNRSITSSAASAATHHARRNLRQQLRRGADAERKQGDDDQKNQSGLRISAPLRHAAQFPGQQRTHHCRLQRRRRGAGAQRTAQRPQRLVGGEDGASPCRACCSGRRVRVSIAVARIHSGASVNHRRVSATRRCCPAESWLKGDLHSPPADGGEGAFPLLKAAGRKEETQVFIGGQRRVNAGFMAQPQQLTVK